MKAVRNSGLAAAVVGIMAITALPASADSVTEVTASSVVEAQQIAVDLTDLDLTSVEGQRTLHFRLANAAREVCGSSDLRRAGSVRMANRNQSCFEESLSRAMAAVPNSQVATTR